VTVHALEVAARDADLLALDVRCSKGTYVRTLAEDIGTALGCGAHLVALRRTGCGPLDVGRAVTLETLAALGDRAGDAGLLPPDSLLAEWPAIELDAAGAARLLCGQRLRHAHADAAALRVYGPPPGGFLGTAHVCRGELIPDRLLAPDEVAAIGSGRRAERIHESMTS
jgi:tRNA pseudouridine55 synthase